jgi:hypothetical protein
VMVEVLPAAFAIAEEKGVPDHCREPARARRRQARRRRSRRRRQPAGRRLQPHAGGRRRTALGGPAHRRARA